MKPIIEYLDLKAEKQSQDKLIRDLEGISPEVAQWSREKFQQGMTTKEVKATIVQGMRNLNMIK